MGTDRQRVDPAVVARFKELEAAAGLADLLSETIDDFEAHGAERLSAIEAALQQADATRVHREAHTLKGGAGTLGATVLRDLAMELEQLGADEDLAGVKGRLPALRQEFTASIAALRAAAAA